MCENKYYPLLVFGIVGPLGSGARIAREALIDTLDSYPYETELIRLTDLFLGDNGVVSLIEGKLNERGKEIAKKAKGKTISEYERIKFYQDIGDFLRMDKKDGSYLAKRAIKLIFEKRKKRENGKGKAFVIHSLKHPDEVALLRLVYGKHFYLIGSYQNEASRKERILETFEPKDKDQRKAIEVMERDYDRSKMDGWEGGLKTYLDTQGIDLKKDFIQNTQDTYPLADLFLETVCEYKARKEIERFVKLIMGYGYHTPTRNEYAMYHAFSASLKASHPSRQVGAAITNKSGNIIVVGTNEVPKYGGGIYEEGDDPDAREFHSQGAESNAQYKKDLIESIIDKIRAEKDEDIKNILKKEFKDIIGYERSVHAEMNALTKAARNGFPLKGSIIYVTTFPCHNCAKHLIATGIDTIIFIDPYVKSEALKLHGDALTMTPNEENKLKVLPFMGIAPTAYCRLFTMVPRCDEDKKPSDFKKSNPHPIYRYIPLKKEYNLTEDNPTYPKAFIEALLNESIKSLEKAIIESLKPKQLPLPLRLGKE